MSKNLARDEIDLLEIILVLWRKKWLILVFVLISLLTIFISQSFKEPKKIIINTKTIIKPITVYDEAKYKIYNAVISIIKPFYTVETFPAISNGFFKPNSELDFKSMNSSIGNFNYSNVGNYQINNINKLFLLDLFIDRINEKDHLINLIKKSSIIEEENYLNKTAYIEAVRELAYSINISKGSENYFINIKTQNLDNLENFLKIIEIETNLVVQKKLYEMLNNYLNYTDSIKRFELEDIQAQIKDTQNLEEKLILEKKKNSLKLNKYSSRIKDIFNASPISKPNEFYAAKILYNLTEYKYDKYYSSAAKYATAGICGAILGIFFVLIMNVVQNRNTK